MLRGDLRRQTGPRGYAAQSPRTLLLIATLLALGLQFLPYANFVLYPLRLFVTFIHESGHALAALLVGGQVDSLTVFSNGEGVTWTRVPGWASWLVFSGGYLGTTVFGAFLLQAGRLIHRRNAGRIALYGASFFILAMTLLYAHNPVTQAFTLGAGIVIAMLLFGLAHFSTPRIAHFLTAFLAVQCCLNAIGDLRILLNLTSMGHSHNDAAFMAQNYGLTPAFWAMIWAGIALMILGTSLRSYWRGTASRMYEPEYE